LGCCAAGSPIGWRETHILDLLHAADLQGFSKLAGLI